MPMKYCGTCQGSQNSMSNDYNRCSRCGNPFNALALNTNSNRNTTALALITNNSTDLARASIAEANRTGKSVEYSHAEGNTASGSYRAEQLNYNPNSGDFSYTKVVFKK